MIRIYSGYIQGIQAKQVEVEVDLQPGLPGFEIVGLAGTATRESRERIRSAIRNSGFSYPLQRITVNLAPANIRKEGPALDLAIALGILACQKLLPNSIWDRYLIAGELSLDGSVRTITGALSLSELTVQTGRKLLIPKENANEAAALPGTTVIPIGSLTEAVEFLLGEREIQPTKAPKYIPKGDQPNLELIRGQSVGKRVLRIAATGHHHTLFLGPPGVGKTMLAQQLVNLLPPISQQEAVTITKIYSNAGLLPEDSGLIQKRPVRSPHHTITPVGLIGGTRQIHPGEVTLSHHGVLILDEMTEFSNECLQALREPLEQGQIALVRSHNRIVYPARFLLIATANPCPCGYLGDRQHICSCRPVEIHRYHRKLAGPLLDRIDIVVYLRPLAKDDYEMAAPIQSPPNPLPRPLVQPSGLMTDEQINHLPITDQGRMLLQGAVAKLNLSTRGYVKTIRVAHTIAHLDNQTVIDRQHLAEALQYRWEALDLLRR